MEVVPDVTGQVQFPPNPDDDWHLFFPITELLLAKGIIAKSYRRRGKRKWRARFIHVPVSGIYEGKRQLATVIFSPKHVSFYPYTDGSGKLWNARRSPQSRLVDVLYELEQALAAKVE